MDSFSLQFGNSSREIEKEFPVSKQAEPGKKILVALRLENKGRLPLIERNSAEEGIYIQVRRTKLDFPAAEAAFQKLSRFLLDLKLGVILFDLAPKETLPSYKVRPISSEYDKNRMRPRRDSNPCCRLERAMS